MAPHGMRLRRAAVAALAAGLAAAGCDRAVEPFDPNERVAAPDLSKIFPKGAERAPGDGAVAGAMRGAPPPGAPGPGGAPPPMPIGVPGAPPGAAPTAGRGAAEAGEPIRGRIVLAPALEGRVPAGSVLFLVARTGEGGPPVAVKRIPDPSFPLDFELGPSDRMLEGVPFTGPFELVARVDADRNAATRNPGDLQGASPARIAPGTEGVELVIDTVL